MGKLLVPIIFFMLLLIPITTVHSQGAKEFVIKLNIDDNQIPNRKPYEFTYIATIINKGNKSYTNLSVSFLFSNETWINKTIPVLGPYESKNLTVNYNFRHCEKNKVEVRVGNSSSWAEIRACGDLPKRNQEFAFLLWVLPTELMLMMTLMFIYIFTRKRKSTR